MVGVHVNYLEEGFAQIRKYDMRLNLEKCVFGVKGGKFLGFMLTERGIEDNPHKCQATDEKSEKSERGAKAGG